MHMPIAAAALAVASLAFVPGASAARFHDPALTAQAPSLMEDVACRTVRERIVRPGGRVIFRTKRVCRPGFGRTFGGGRCRMVRERVVRPNGSVVYRSVRRCR
jgi:hypothetical protein